MGGAFFPAPPQQTEERGFRWYTIGAGAAIVVVLIVLLVVFGRSPQQPPVASEALQPEYASNLHISELKLSAAENFVGGTVNYIDGKITNSGEKTVSACRVEAVFRNSLGQIVQREAQPLMILQERKGYGYQDLTPLSTAPLYPNQVREFRMTFEHISADWDHGYPELRVLSLTFK